MIAPPNDATSMSLWWINYSSTDNSVWNVDVARACTCTCGYVYLRFRLYIYLGLTCGHGYLQL